jgi:hypothetical protein
MSSRRWLVLGLLGAAAAVWGFGVHAAVTANPVTLPNRVTWLGADGRPLDLGTYDTACGLSNDDRLVLGDRLIIPCAWRNPPHAYAYVEPRSRTARIAWPLPASMTTLHTLGYAPREDGMFGVVFETTVGERRQLAVALAGRDGWAVPPTIIANRENGHDHASPYAIGWVGGAVEVVVGRPAPGFGNDPFGMRRAPEIVRLVPGSAPERAVHPFPAECEDPSPLPRQHCYLFAAIPGAQGWKLIAERTQISAAGIEKSIVVISETGAMTPAPPELAPWDDRLRKVDAAALGLIEDRGIYDESPVIERDGTRHPPPPSPHPAYTLAAEHSHAFVDGVLRTHVAWLHREAAGAVFAHHGAPIYIDTRDEVRIGADPDRLAPVATRPGALLLGAFLPAPGGRYWVTTEGELVTLDHELRRTDPRSLYHHLRTRGSVLDSIDEAALVWRAGWIVLGLPIALAAGAILMLLVPRRARGGVIATAAGCYLGIALLLLRGFLASLA